MGSSHSTFSIEKYKEMIPPQEMSAFFIFCKTFFENHTFDDMYMEQNPLVDPKYLAVSAWVSLTPAQKEPYILSAKQAFHEAEQEGYKYNPEDYETHQPRNVYGQGGNAGRFVDDVYYGVSDDEDLWRVEELDEDNEEELQQEESDDVYDEDGEWWWRGENSVRRPVNT